MNDDEAQYVWELSPLHKLATKMFDETKGTVPILEEAIFNRNHQDYYVKLTIEQDRYHPPAIRYWRRWFKAGRKEGYPLCCIVWFCIVPHKLMIKYSERFRRNYYVPCPIHRKVKTK